ncbi:hypothetical protein [Magnetococcus sp. PR-3]|uniref:hypothetical protein n=1 Tax=Magnetococcus sp. PR-3 TaxID=3120355 RepID=UPI002FCDF23D
MLWPHPSGLARHKPACPIEPLPFAKPGAGGGLGLLGRIDPAKTHRLGGHQSRPPFAKLGAGGTCHCTQPSGNRGALLGSTQPAP